MSKITKLTKLSFVLIAMFASTAISYGMKAQDVPIPTKTQELILSSDYEGKTLYVTFEVDVDGQPINVVVISPVDEETEKKIVSSISSWEFVPKHQDGVPVKTRVRLPIVVTSS